MMQQFHRSCPSLIPTINKSLDVVDEAMDKYQLNEMCIGFNGGKDSVVLLHMVLLNIFRRFYHQSTPLVETATTTENCDGGGGNDSEDLKSKNEYIMRTYFNQILCFHLFQPNEFPEMVQFLCDQIALYHLNMQLVNENDDNSNETNSVGHEKQVAQQKSSSSSKSSSSFKHLLSYLMQQNKNLKAVFMGTRHNDPHGHHVSYFSPTDASWPQMMRISPVLHWNYDEIWTFINTLHIPYCVLYDRGYTSIGSVHDTIPNPYLLIVEKGDDDEGGDDDSIGTTNGNAMNGNGNENGNENGNCVKHHGVGTGVMGKERKTCMYKRAHLLENGNEYERYSRVTCPPTPTSPASSKSN